MEEYVRKHTRGGDLYVTVILHLTDRRSTQAFTTWLAERTQAWRDGVEVVAMDGLTGFKTAAAENSRRLRGHRPLHVVRVAGDTLDERRLRVQQIIHAHRGHKDDLLYRARRTCTPAPISLPTTAGFGMPSVAHKP